MKLKNVLLTVGLGLVGVGCSDREESKPFTSGSK